ncbi:MAG: hypothetical protein P8Y62_04100 [candidate division WOR-3 bacterium]
MKKKIWIKKFDFSQSAEEEFKYYSSLTSREKLSIMQELREEELKRKNENGEGLRRVFKFIKQK